MKMNEAKMTYMMIKFYKYKTLQDICTGKKQNKETSIYEQELFAFKNAHSLIVDRGTYLHYATLDKIFTTLSCFK